MNYIPSSDLKSILHSKRANLYYLEHCRVLVKGGRVEYVTEQKNQSLYWNIPIANTTSIILGTGTSVTQAAIRELSKAGVLVGFCGGGGAPLYSSQEQELEVSWFSPQSEYRPTEYLQRWVKFWFNESCRLSAAKSLQLKRLDRTLKQWTLTRNFPEDSFIINKNNLKIIIDESKKRVETSIDTTALLVEEARLTKKLYQIASNATFFGEFKRSSKGEKSNIANQFLDHGNYLAYGLGATATWVLGLPHSLAILHGKTRRGGLVFDAADLIKDATVLPRAFISAMRGENEHEFRQSCIDSFINSESLDFIIDSLKEISLQQSSAEIKVD